MEAAVETGPVSETMTGTSGWAAAARRVASTT